MNIFEMLGRKKEEYADLREYVSIDASGKLNAIFYKGGGHEVSVSYRDDGYPSMIFIKAEGWSKAVRKDTELLPFCDESIFNTLPIYPDLTRPFKDSVLDIYHRECSLFVKGIKGNPLYITEYLSLSRSKTPYPYIQDKRYITDAYAELVLQPDYVKQHGIYMKADASEDRRVYLNVPYEEKDMAKALGAKWDANQKCWYCKAFERERFSKWNNRVSTKQKIGNMELA